MKYPFLSSVILISLCVSYSSGVYAQSSMKSSANVTMFGAGTAFTLPQGDGFIGATIVDPRGGVQGSGSDGDLAFGAGFGNPFKSVGFEVDVNVTSLKDNFADSGSLTLKASRALFAQPNHVVFGSISAANLGAWGEAKASDESFNLTFSGITQIDGYTLIHPLMWTLGYGSDPVLITAGSSQTEEGIFAGLGLGITEYFGISLSVTENQLNSGVGFKIPGLDGVSISYGINDITDNMERKQQTLSISYSLTGIFGG
jgi:hypothetical protein